MNKDLKKTIVLALQNQPSANFSSEDCNAAAINGIMEEIGLTADSDAREIRAAESRAFALIEESIDEILPKKLEQVLGEFAEVKSFPRDAEMLFNIDRIGKNRAKLTITKGARGGIYRAARLDTKYFSVNAGVQTVAVYVTLEELILGTMSLSELYNNVLEGFQEIVYKEVFTALATGTAVAGYDRIQPESGVTTTKSALGAAIDSVMPVVRQYGAPTIFGSYQAVSELGNPGAEFHPELEDSADRRKYGFVQLYKGCPVVMLPNYLVDNGNETWFYDPKYVFVMPSGVKPVKVGLKGELYIEQLKDATGSETWQAHKIIGVGVAMANNYAVIEVSDIK